MNGDSYTYTDVGGTHIHSPQTGPPYEAKLPLTCEACITKLDSVMVDWLAVLTERHSLPDTFWNSYRWRPDA